MLFRDRADAGRQLAQQVAGLGALDAVVFAVPRGGVPVGFEVARTLRAPLDVVVVRKVLSPTHSGVALGAVAEGRRGYVHAAAILDEGASPEEIEALTEAELDEVDRRVDRWRGVWPSLPVRGRAVIVVDDGVVTGDIVRAAVLSLKARQAHNIVLAAPLATRAALESLSDNLDAFVCLHIQDEAPPLHEVYGDAAAPDDDEIFALLERAQEWQPAPSDPPLMA